MRTFQKFPEDIACPICGTSDDGECILLGVVGTEDGLNMEAKPFHIDCLEINNFIYYPEQRFIGRKF